MNGKGKSKWDAEVQPKLSGVKPLQNRIRCLITISVGDKLSKLQTGGISTSQLVVLSIVWGNSREGGGTARVVVVGAET
uniref:Uncharacterized protein n=1 Tax=Globodera rostochiensis TaxID=31243 RepID=A0A914HEP1_GLORO